MVDDAILITEELAEEVSEEAGEVTLSAVRSVVDPVELESVERAVLEGETDSVVFVAALEGPEEGMVKEAAQRAGMRPTKWLTEKVIGGEKAPLGYTSIEQIIEDAIFRYA